MSFSLRSRGFSFFASLALVGGLAFCPGCGEKGKDERSRDRGAAGGALEVKRGGTPPTGPVDRVDPPLHVAARSGDVAKVKEILNDGADVNQWGDDRKTALMAAAETGKEEVVTALLERGADANLRDAKGRTAAQIAREKGHGAVTKLLEREEVQP